MGNPPKKLSLSQLQEITLGALEITEDADGFHFERMTAAQVDTFARANATFEPKCHAPSGVRLDFETDSDLLAVRWHKPIITTRTFCFFDVLVDGVLTMHSGTYDCAKEPEGGFCFALPEGMHRVQVFLPTVVGVCLSSVSLSDGAKVIPHRPAKRILVHGDSITQGYDALFPSACYANTLARHYNAEIVNQAVGGAFFNREVLQRVGDFDFVFVAYGTNDWAKKTVETFGPDTAAFWKQLKELYPETQVFALLPIWRADALTREVPVGDFLESRALIGKLAAERGFTVLDDYDLLPHDTRLFSDGYLHPNDMGFKLYSARLIQMIDESRGPGKTV